MEITFKIIEDDRMCFTPGRFIIVKISDNPMIMRAYGVLNYDTGSNELSIVVKKVVGGQGATIKFDDFKVGMEIKTIKNLDLYYL